jgi:hypothetical protein
MFIEDLEDVTAYRKEFHNLEVLFQDSANTMRRDTCIYYKFWKHTSLKNPLS